MYCSYIKIAYDYTVQSNLFQPETGILFTCIHEIKYSQDLLGSNNSSWVQLLFYLPNLVIFGRSSGTDWINCSAAGEKRKVQMTYDSIPLTYHVAHQFLKIKNKTNKGYFFRLSTNLKCLLPETGSRSIRASKIRSNL